jgi:hypothetical protein
LEVLGTLLEVVLGEVGVLVFVVVALMALWESFGSVVSADIISGTDWASPLTEESPFSAQAGGLFRSAAASCANLRLRQKPYTKQR